MIIAIIALKRNSNCVEDNMGRVRFWTVVNILMVVMAMIAIWQSMELASLRREIRREREAIAAMTTGAAYSRAREEAGDDQNIFFL